MTEDDWLTSPDLPTMLSFVRDKGSRRQWRLYLAACCRAAWDALPPSAHRSIETAEDWTDGEHSERVRENARSVLYHDYLQATEEYQLSLVQRRPGEWVGGNPLSDAELAAFLTRQGRAKHAADATTVAMGVLCREEYDPENHFGEAINRSGYLVAPPFAASYLRCIFNPFHPNTLDSSWMSTPVVSLARQMYESGDFSAMPILADALQDAGCQDEAILSHCRGDGPHVRGCFVVDACLSKS